MSDYLDASLLVSAFVPDDHTPKALAYLASRRDFTTSSWAAAEFSSALAIQTRAGRLHASDRNQADAALDRWLTEMIDIVPLAPDDATAVRSVLRSIMTPLRAPDALHLVICRRLGATLVSFDIRLRDAARELNLAVRDL